MRLVVASPTERDAVAEEMPQLRMRFLPDDVMSIARVVDTALLAHEPG